MTGRYNIRYGLQTQVIPNNKAYGLPLSEVTVADRLRALGYRTHAVGKWHLGLYRWEYTPTYRGFDSYLGYYSGAEEHFTHKKQGCSSNYYDLANNTGFRGPIRTTPIRSPPSPEDWQG